MPICFIKFDTFSFVVLIPSSDNFVAILGAQNLCPDSLKAKVGLNDYITYATEKASVDELKRQHSYFIDALYRDRG